VVTLGGKPQERDGLATFLLCIIVRYLPADEKAKPEPPKKPRNPVKRLTMAERARTKGQPSWNGQPKRDWDGPELPPKTGSKQTAAKSAG
jgi:hypothetical protein